MVGLLIVDLQEALNDFQEKAVEELDARGVEVAVVPGGRRAEWVGVFSYEVELRLRITGFHAAHGEDLEAIQAGAWPAIRFVIGAIVILYVGWVAESWAEAWKEAPETVIAASNALSLLAIAAGLFAIGWLVSQLNKSPTPT